MWTESIAKIWTNYVPPCRPSRFELDTCGLWLEKLRKIKGTTPRILILGSTTEYRDWAYEERCDVTIIDNSLEYHNAISEERTHKNWQEKLIIEDWQSISFVEKFDMIVGDLIIGNLLIEEIDPFLRSINKALVREGLFLTKSFFFSQPVNDTVLIKEFKEYEERFPYLDPFPILAYSLASNCVNEKSFLLEFEKMFLKVLSIYNEGHISKKTFERFSEFGWQHELKSPFYMVTFERWEQLAKLHFWVEQKVFAPYHWANNFPYYVLRKK